MTERLQESDDRTKFVAGDAGYGPLAAADEREFGSAFKSQQVSLGFWCRLGLHRWRIEDRDGLDYDRLNVLACARCGVERGS